MIIIFVYMPFTVEIKLMTVFVLILFAANLVQSATSGC